MKPFASRYLLLAAFSVLLSACQSKPVEQPAPVAPPDAYQQLEQNIASSELATAEDQLAALQSKSRTIPDSSNTSVNWLRPI